MPHSNSQKRFIYDQYYFITCATKNKTPYFKEEIFCYVFVQSLKIIKVLKKCEIIAWCLLYYHFHIILYPKNNIANLSQIMQALKKNVSQDINKIINGYDEGANSNSRLQGIDISNYKQRFVEQNTKGYKFIKFQRQKSYHDHIIRNQYDFEVHYNYTLNNYIKHDLPHNRKYFGGDV